MPSSVENEVGSVPEFHKFYSERAKDSALKREIEDIGGELKRRPMMGIKIPQDRWPEIYVREYGITNLFKIDLSGGRRLVYDIQRVKQVRRMRFIEYFPTHGAYEKRFGYK